MGRVSKYLVVAVLLFGVLMALKERNRNRDNGRIQKKAQTRVHP